MTTLGTRLRRYRIQAQLSQAQLALGIVSPSMLSRIESDARRPSRQTLIALAERIGVRAEELEGDDPCAVGRDRTRTLVELGEQLLLDEEYEEAERLASRVIHEPADARRRSSALRIRARARAGQGRNTHARSDLERALHLAHTNGHVDLALGIAVDLRDLGLAS